MTHWMTAFWSKSFKIKIDSGIIHGHQKGREMDQSSAKQAAVSSHGRVCLHAVTVCLHGYRHYLHDHHGQLKFVWETDKQQQQSENADTIPVNFT